MAWDIQKAEEFCVGVTDGTHDSPKAVEDGRFLITSKHLGEFEIDFSSAKKISEEDYKKIIVRSTVGQWDILFSMIGTIGTIYLEKSEIVEYACKNMGIFQMGGDEEKAYWFYYYLKSPQAKEYIFSHLRGSTQQYLPLGGLREFPIPVPEEATRKKIVGILKSIDNKIENNTRINRNLEDQVIAIYYKMFVETKSEKRTVCRAEEVFNITIGKTPPRKEKEWFSSVSTDRVWISISDMGSCGTFINDSSEYLTQEAIEKFNVKVVLDNTVILSFKLTVGRIAITVGSTTTNEAIAHFNTDNDRIVEYLYCYLKSFDFGLLGSTSSIGTAVNSKTIKAMDFVMPEERELQEFYEIANPIFKQIKNNQFENQNLISMRDYLLPRLMSGELDVSDLKA